MGPPGFPALLKHGCGQFCISLSRRTSDRESDLSSASSRPLVASKNNVITAFYIAAVETELSDLPNFRRGSYWPRCGNAPA